MRDTWNTRTAFILASIGSAIGLGNIWRFPFVCYENGGGAFLIAYAIVLFLVGIPLLMLEFGIGQRAHQAGPGAFRQFHLKFEWFGWIATGVAFVIVIYYAIVMSWAVNYTYQSFTLGWGENPKDYFYQTLLGLSSGISETGKFQWSVFWGLLVSWICVIACIWKGTKTVSKVIYFTVTVPWLLLVVFVIRGITLPGAAKGLLFYLKPEMKMLLNFNLWLQAISQVCFSLSVGFAVMVAYGSFLKKDADIVQNAMIIGVADALTAFVGGLAVFGALGHKAFVEGKAITEIAKGGPGLAFVTYPEIINNLPFAPLFGFLFFIMLLLLAIDSAFSIVEAVTTAIHDKTGWSHKQSNLIVATIAFLLGIPLCFGSGLFILDTYDHFMMHIGLPMVVLLECIIVGYYFGAGKMREYLNVHSIHKANKWWDYRIKLILPGAILVMFIKEIADRFKGAYSGYWGTDVLYGWRIIILIIFISFVMTKISQNKENTEL